MLFFIFWPLPEKLLDCPKKIILPDSGGLQPLRLLAPPPAHTPMYAGVSSLQPSLCGCGSTHPEYTNSHQLTSLRKAHCPPSVDC